jgi:hypothetical protein
MKSPLQLEQWAAYEAITAKRAQAVEQVKHTKKDSSLLFSQASDWKTAQAIRSFVAETVANLPLDADADAHAGAAEWQTWALGVADELDPI